MPNSKPHHRRNISAEERNQISKERRVPEKSMSFHGRGGAVGGGPMSPAAISPSSSALATEKLRRPKTVPDLLLSRSLNIGSNGGGSSSSGSSPMVDGKPRLTKILLNVTIQGTVGAVQVLMSLDLSVKDLIAAAIKQHVKEGRRPVFPTSDPSGFDLHYSQFSLESLDRGEKLAALGSRNFFLYKRKESTVVSDSRSNSGDSSLKTRNTSCSKEAEEATKSGFSGLPWLKFMSFLQCD